MHWISIKDEKPLDDETVFCYNSKQSSSCPFLCYYQEETDSFIYLDSFREIHVIVSHWMPLTTPHN
jgi:hypothetical protein